MVTQTKNKMSAQQKADVLNHLEFGIQNNAETPLNFSEAYKISEKLLAAIIHSEKECEHIPYATVHEGGSDASPILAAAGSVIESIKQENVGALDSFAIFKTFLAGFLIKTLVDEAKSHNEKLNSALNIYTKLALVTHELHRESLELLERGAFSDEERIKLQRRVNYACKKADEKRISSGILFDKPLENNSKYQSPVDVIREARKRGLISQKRLEGIPTRLQALTDLPKVTLTKIFCNAASNTPAFVLNIATELLKNFGRYPAFVKDTIHAIPKATKIAVQYKFFKNELRARFARTQPTKLDTKKLSAQQVKQASKNLESLSAEIGQAKSASYACLVQASFALTQAVSCAMNIATKNYPQAVADWQSIHFLILAQQAFNKQVEASDQILHGHEAHKVDDASREKGLLDQDTQLLPPEEEKPPPPSQANDNTPEP